MKPTSRFAFVFALLVITFTLLTPTALAYDSNKSRTERTATIQTSTNIVHQAIVTTEQNGALRTSMLYAFTEDNRALRSNPFAMPDPTQYVISVSHGLGSAIRKAPIKRKGNIQG
jgi:hypothetical protein